MPVPTGWFKSSYSGAADDNCVEVRFADAVGVRDSKHPAATLAVPATSWRAFTAMVNRSIG
jgi:hypothetical protein